MARLNELLDAALRSHQTGDLARAETLYREILQADPNNVDAWHLWGLIAHQTGHADVACQRIGRALGLSPQTAVLHFNLGEVHRQSGALAQAAACYREAVRLAPGLVEAYNNLGIVLRDQGQLAEAAAAYRQALTLKPEHAAAWNNLGEILGRQGDLEEAGRCLQHALQIQPNSPAVYLNWGPVLRQQGRLPEAAACYRQAVALDPQNAEAYLGLAAVLRDLGQLDEALTCCHHALQLQPDAVELQNDVGSLLREQRRLDEAVTCYRQTLRQHPHHAATYNNLGLALRDQGKRDEAAACYRRAVELEPGFAEAHNNLAILALDQERWDDALVCAQRAVGLRPDYASAHNTLGEAYRRQGELARAEACYRQALAHDPRFWQAYLNLAMVLGALGRWGEMAESCQRSLELHPHQATGHNLLGEAYRHQDQFAQAEASYRRALEIAPEYWAACGNLGQLLSDQGRIAEARPIYARGIAIRSDPQLQVTAATLLPVICDSVEQIHQVRTELRENLQGLLDRGVRLDVTRDPMPTLFYLAYHGENDRELNTLLGRLVGPEPGPPPRRTPGPRLRVGFLSRLLMEHTVGRLNIGLVSQLDRKQFEVVLIADRPTKNDGLSQRFATAADQFVALPANLAEARRVLADLRLDVLYFPDIGMVPFTYSLACSRWAPIQCTTWGHPVTSGLPTIDYFLSSRDLETAPAEHYTETVVPLTRLGVYYERPTGPQHPPARSAFGLDEQSHLYLCPQTLFKFHPDFDPVLAEVLDRDPRGVLLLLESKYCQWKEMLLQRFGRTLGGAAARVRFLPTQPRARFLELLALADVVLDPLHFGGGNTSYEALAVGTPVVTLPSPFLRARLTYALYRQMGVDEWIAAGPEQYAELAVRLGTDADYRRYARERIGGRCAVLFKDSQAVREVESFFLNAAARMVAS